MALVVVLVAAGGIYYYAQSTQGKSSTSCTTVSTFSSGGVETTVTLPCGSGQTNVGGGSGTTSQQTSSTQSSSSSRSSTTSTSTSTSTSTNMIETFNGHFEWSHTANYTTTIETFSASGTFTISIDLAQRSGQGAGRGTIDDKITGICTGESTTDYTFIVGGGIDPITGNLTLAFLTPTPATGTTSETCQNSGTTNNSFGFLAVYPPQVNIQATYGASVQGTLSEYTYEITLA
jgi:mucin-6/19